MFKPARALLALGAVLACALTPVGAASAAPAQSRPASTGFTLEAASASNLPYRATLVASSQLRNENAVGKCIGISGGFAGDWNCTTNPDQTWHWGPGNSFGYDELINGNGQCLAVSAGSVSQGARILGYSCLGTSDQYWYRDPTSDSLYNYNAVFNGSSTADVVGVSGASTANGAPLVLWRANGSADQKWY